MMQEEWITPATFKNIADASKWDLALESANRDLYALLRECVAGSQDKTANEVRGNVQLYHSRDLALN